MSQSQNYCFSFNSRLKNPPKLSKRKCTRWGTLSISIITSLLLKRVIMQWKNPRNSSALSKAKYCTILVAFIHCDECLLAYLWLHANWLTRDPICQADTRTGHYWRIRLGPALLHTPAGLVKLWTSHATQRTAENHRNT